MPSGANQAQQATAIVTAFANAMKAAVEAILPFNRITTPTIQAINHELPVLAAATTSLAESFRATAAQAQSRNSTAALPAASINSAIAGAITAMSRNALALPPARAAAPLALALPPAKTTPPPRQSTALATTGDAVSRSMVGIRGLTEVVTALSTAASVATLTVRDLGISFVNTVLGIQSIGMGGSSPAMLGAGMGMGGGSGPIALPPPQPTLALPPMGGFPMMAQQQQRGQQEAGESGIGKATRDAIPLLDQLASVITAVGRAAAVAAVGLRDLGLSIAQLLINSRSGRDNAPPSSDMGLPRLASNGPLALPPAASGSASGTAATTSESLNIFMTILKGIGAAAFATGVAIKLLPPALVGLTGHMLDGVKGVIALGAAVTNFVRQMVQGGAAILAGPMRALDAGIGAINQNVTRFVSLIDPGAVFRFQYAVDSLYATIGSMLVPVLNQLTAIIKTIAGEMNFMSDRGKMVVAALAAGTVGLVVFGAAVAALQAVLTGGIGPVIGAVVGAIGGVMLATGKLQPIFSMLSATMATMMDQMGGALDVAASAFEAILPTIAAFAQEGAGFVTYLIEAFQRAVPTMAALAEVLFAVMRPVMMLNEMYFAVLIEGLMMVGEAFTFVAPAIMLVAETVGKAVKMIMGWVRDLLALIGINLTFAKEPTAPSVAEQFAQGGAKGAQKKDGLAPVRAPAFSTALEDLKKAQLSAYSLGGGTGLKAEEKTAIATQSIAQKTEEMKMMLQAFFDWMRNAMPQLLVVEGPRAVANFLKVVLGSFGSGVKDGVKEFTNRGVEAPGGGKITPRDAANIYVNPGQSVIDGGKWLLRQFD